MKDKELPKQMEPADALMLKSDDLEMKLLEASFREFQVKAAAIEARTRGNVETIFNKYKMKIGVDQVAMEPPYAIERK